MLDEAKMNEDKSQKRAIQLEGEIKMLKKELAKKSTEISSIRRSATIRTPPSQPVNPAPQVKTITFPIMCRICIIR